MTDQRAVAAKDRIRDYILGCIDVDKIIDWSVVHGIIASEYEPQVIDRYFDGNPVPGVTGECNDKDVWRLLNQLSLGVAHLNRLHADITHDHNHTETTKVATTAPVDGKPVPGVTGESRPDRDRFEAACRIAEGLNGNPNVWCDCDGSIQSRIDIVAESIFQADALLYGIRVKKGT